MKPVKAYLEYYWRFALGFAATVVLTAYATLQLQSHTAFRKELGHYVLITVVPLAVLAVLALVTWRVSKRSNGTAMFGAAIGGGVIVLVAGRLANQLNVVMLGALAIVAVAFLCYHTVVHDHFIPKWLMVRWVNFQTGQTTASDSGRHAASSDDTPTVDSNTAPAVDPDNQADTAEQEPVSDDADVVSLEPVRRRTADRRSRAHVFMQSR